MNGPPSFVDESGVWNNTTLQQNAHKVSGENKVYTGFEYGPMDPHHTRADDGHYEREMVHRPGENKPACMFKIMPGTQSGIGLAGREEHMNLAIHSPTMWGNARMDVPRGRHNNIQGLEYKSGMQMPNMTPPPTQPQAQPQSHISHQARHMPHHSQVEPSQLRMMDQTTIHESIEHQSRRLRETAPSAYLMPSEYMDSRSIASPNMMPIKKSPYMEPSRDPRDGSTHQLPMTKPGNPDIPMFAHVNPAGPSAQNAVSHHIDDRNKDGEQSYAGPRGPYPTPASSVYASNHSGYVLPEEQPVVTVNVTSAKEFYAAVLNKR